jgi:hypothetical protein
MRHISSHSPVAEICWSAGQGTTLWEHSSNLVRRGTDLS